MIHRARSLNALITHVAVPLALAGQAPVSGRVYDQLEVTRSPQVVQAPQLSLPNRFDLTTVRDTVVLTFVVDTTGRVDPSSIVVIRAGDSTLRAALIARELAAIYTPGRVGKKAVPVRLRRQFPQPPPPTAVVRVPIATIRERTRALVGGGPFVAPTLSYRYRRRESCEGYPCGCSYGTWQAKRALPVFPAERDTSRAAFEIAEGARFEAEPGDHHVLRPGVVIVLDTVQDYQHRFRPGDTLLVLQYVGELSYRVRHRDSVTEVHQFWAPQTRVNPRGALVQAGSEEWWVPIRTVDGRRGWIRPRDRESVQGPNPFCIPAADSTIW